MPEIDLKKDDQQLQADITVTLHPEDYQSEMDEKLKEYKKTAKIPGFRPGKTPKSVLRKMIGKDLKKEIVPKKVWEKIDEYLKENDIQTLSSPKVLKEPQEEDFSQYDSFTWEVKLGLKPEVNIELSQLDQVPEYKPIVDEKVLEDNLNTLLKEYGEFKEQEKIEPGQEEQIINVTWTELDENKEEVEGGVNQDGHFKYSSLPKKARPQLDNLKQEEEVIVNPGEIFEASELAGLIGIEEQAARDLHQNLKIKVNKILYKEPAALDQSLFDQILGEGQATSEEEFKQQYKERLEEYFNERAENELFERIRLKLLENHDFSLPENFIWENMKEDNEKQSNPASEDELKEQFKQALKYGKWSVIAETIQNENEIEVSTEEIVEQGKADLQQLISQYYGFSPDPNSEEFNNALQKYIQNQDNYQKAYSKVRDNKVFRHLKEKIQTSQEEISVEDFQKQEEKTFKQEEESNQETTSEKT